ncbi:Spy/CpxP family protein refolding chaperone [Marinomonas pollencensis]|nr:Spy/CpxP family protein refolding chaperone [Marinomonas pollencensis]
MTKKLILATVMFPIALGTASAFAAGKDDHKRSAMERCQPGPVLNPKIMKRLELTDAQKEQFKALRNANRTEMKAKMDARDKRMNDLLMADTFDKDKAEAMVKEAQNNRVQRQVDRLENQFKMLSILTPAQKEKLMEFEKKHQQKCGEMMHHGKGDRK